MSLQLTPFDPYASRSSALLPAAEPSPVAPAAPVAAAGTALGDGAPGRHPSNAANGAPAAAPAARSAGAGHGHGPGAAAVDPGTVPSTVSLGKAADPAATAPPADPAVGRVAAKPEPPVSEQLLEFLHSMWQAGAHAITLPKEKDEVPGIGAVAGVEAVAGAGGTAAAALSAARATGPAASAASVAAGDGSGQDAGHPSDARPATASARAGNPPVLGNALDDNLPSITAPTTAPLVYADPTLRRPSGR